MNTATLENQSFNGLLFIGDPHVASKRPGRRKDDYLSSVLGKLSRCAALCRERNLLPYIAGDLLHTSDDNSLRMLNRLIRVLKEFPTPPLLNEGNHDTRETEVGDDDTLMVLKQAGLVHVVSRPEFAPPVQLEGKWVNLYVVPHGSALPDAVPPAPPADLCLVLTHHDLAFGTAYPGAAPLKEIEGAAVVLNGHMHDTKKSVQVGATWYHNPGNIEPVSYDDTHTPYAWEWRPSLGPERLVPHELPHGTDLFDLTGIQVTAADADASVQKVVQQSEFALILGEEEQSAMDAARTEDASILQEDLEEVFAAADVSPATQVLLRSIAQAVAAQAVAS